jgi:SAM-dependent methyltransferase
MAPKADYGLDAPGDVGKFILAGLILTGVGALVARFRAGRKPALAAVAAGGWLLGIAALLVLSSKVGKLRERDRLLDNIELRGDEHVLDVGCGRGLLLIGAAKRLTDGHAVGVDIWSTIDQSGNSPAALLANTSAEGVTDRVRPTSGDIRWLPFADGSFVKSMDTNVIIV